MGASSSISNIKMENHTYISYATNDSMGEFIHNELLRVGLNIVQGSLTSLVECNFATPDFSLMIKRIMVNSNLILICISEKTVTSYHQAIEINNALDSNKPIVYIFTDKNFTPANTEYPNGFVKCNKWLPAYDEETRNATLEVLESPTYSYDINLLDLNPSLCT